MGAVYEARQVSLDRKVALKILPPELAGDAARLRRFEREARALAAIEHPNIVSIHAVEEIEGLHFISMELVRGEPLSSAVPRGGLAAEKLLDLAVQISDALAAAHRQGVTHRDLKPANIMIGEDGRLKILDFGLAKLRRECVGPVPPDSGASTESRSVTEAGQVLGTLPYMSPEQIEGKAVDARSDLFSLGVILHEMATGRRPFSGDTWASLASSILRDAPQPVCELRPDLPADLGRMLRLCLQKDPGRRYQTAADLRNELEELRKELAGPAGIRPWARAAWPVAGAALLALAAFAVHRATSREAPASRPRIAVLPFENLGPPEDAYFAGGMTEEITSRLASVDGLSVISRASAQQYNRTGRTIKDIGKDLAVSYVLDGTVRWDRDARDAGRVRITPQLVRVSDDTQLWGQSFDRVIGDVFSVQSEIAENVAARLGVALRAGQRRALGARPTESLDAYQAYLRGRHFAAQPHFSERSWREVLGSYQRAVTLDPGFALAWAELCKAHARFRYFRVDLSEERRQLARQALERAQALAPDAPEVHLATGFYHFWVERDPGPALGQFALAARELPDSAEALDAQAEALRMRGQWQAALEGYRRALDLSPRDAAVTVELATTSWWLRRHAEARGYADQAIALAPDQAWPYLIKVFNDWTWKGRSNDARAALEFVPADHEWWLWSWYWQEMIEGRYRDALRRLEAAPEAWIRQKMWAAPKATFAGLAHEMLREPRAARAAYDSARRLLEAELARHPDDPRYHSALGIAYAALGRGREAIAEGRRATELLPMEKDAFYGFSHLHDLAVIYVMAGEDAAALREIERLLSVPSFISPAWLRANPQWARLWGDPHFEALLAKHQ